MGDNLFHASTAGYVVAFETTNKAGSPILKVWADVFPDVAMATEAIHWRGDHGDDQLFNRRVLALVPLSAFDV